MEYVKAFLGECSFQLSSFVRNSGHNCFGILKQYVGFYCSGLEFSIEFYLPSAEAGSFSN